jgi:voltage-gated potassium channel
LNKATLPEARPLGTRPSRLRAAAFTLLEEGELTSILGRVAQGLLITLIIANVVAVALETIPSVYARWHVFFSDFEKFSIGAYTVEYIVRMWSSVEDPRIAARGSINGRISFALRPLMIVDFFAFAPSYLSLLFPVDLRILRIFRLFRLVKLARYSHALPALLGVLYAERSALFASGILLISTTCVTGEFMHLAEGDAQPKVLGTLPDAMYWAITTLTTVGYGDVVPITPLGKFIAGVTEVFGLLLFALPIGIIANGFVSGLNRRRFAITWSTLKQQPLFEGFGVTAMTDLMESVKADIVPEHGQITLTGEPANALFLIVSGSARAEGDDADELSRVGAIIGPEALNHQATYAQTITARTTVRVMVLSREDLRRLARKNSLLRQRVESAIKAQKVGAAPAVDPERRLSELEVENQRLKNALADMVLDKLALRKTIESGAGDQA